MIDVGYIVYTIVIFIIGGIFGFVTFALLRTAKDSDNAMETLYYEDCQIHDSYKCLDNTGCKGNPMLCGGSCLK